MTSRALRYALAWVVAAALAVTVGVLAVTSAGAGVRDRGQVGTALPPADLAATPSADPDAQRVRNELDDEFGALVVECRGTVAHGIEARPDTAAGWQVVSFETEPDDDIDAVFSQGPRSIEIEVFCNRGRPTVSDREEHVLEGD